MSELKKAISSTIVRLLKPLVTILLRNGIPYGTFCELAKWVYVATASEEFHLGGKKQTTSRISVLTGLSRKEVKRVREIPGPDDLGSSDRYNRAVRVISGWRKDSRFLDNNGNPAALPVDRGEASFSSLVKAYSGDIPHKAVLDEMTRTGVVEIIDQKVRLLSKEYIVSNNEIENLSILGTDVSELISTINHNLTSSPDELFLQRKTMYDNIPATLMPELRKQIRQESEKFIEAMDSLIAGYDRDINPSVKGEGRKKAGLGIFQIE